MVFGPNDSPLAGRAGKAVTGRVIGERLQAEAETSVSLRVISLPGTFRSWIPWVRSWLGGCQTSVSLRARHFVARYVLVGTSFHHSYIPNADIPRSWGGSQGQILDGLLTGVEATCPVKKRPLP